jgi:hypothetical protein
MKVYWGSGGIAPSILDLGTRWMCVISFTPLPLYPQSKSPWYPLYSRLCGPQRRSGRGGEINVLHASEVYSPPPKGTLCSTMTSEVHKQEVSKPPLPPNLNEPQLWLRTHQTRDYTRNVRFISTSNAKPKSTENWGGGGCNLPNKSLQKQI